MVERRQFKRYRFERAVSITTATRKDRAGLARDISATGILFHSRSALALGERVVLVFTRSRKLTSTTGSVIRAWIEVDAAVLPHAAVVEFDVANLDLVA